MTTMLVPAKEERLFYMDRGDGYEAPVLCRECKTWLLGPEGRCECRILCDCQYVHEQATLARVPLTNVAPADGYPPCCDECATEIRREVRIDEAFALGDLS